VAVLRTRLQVCISIFTILHIHYDLTQINLGCLSHKLTDWLKAIAHKILGGTVPDPPKAPMSTGLGWFYFS